MLNERLQNVVHRKADHYVWFTREKNVQFPFNGNEAAVVAKLNGLLEKIDKVRGSETPSRLLITGVENRRDDRPYQSGLREDIKTWKPDESKNPYRRMLELHDEEHGTKVSTLDQIRADNLRKAEEWEEQQEAAQELVERHSSKAYQTRLSEASERFIVSNYSDVNVTDHRRASALYDAAMDGNRELYKELHAQFTADAEARLVAADKALLAEQQKIVDERQSLGSADFDYSTEPEPVVPESNTPAEDSAKTNESDIY